MKFEEIEVDKKFSIIVNGKKVYFKKTDSTLGVRLSDNKVLVFYPEDEVEPTKN